MVQNKQLALAERNVETLYYYVCICTFMYMYIHVRFTWLEQGKGNLQAQIPGLPAQQPLGENLRRSLCCQLIRRTLAGSLCLYRSSEQI